MEEKEKEKEDYKISVEDTAKISKLDEANSISWNQKPYYAGKLSGFKDANEKAMYDKMLKNHLKGNSQFLHGYKFVNEGDKGKWVENWVQVLRSETQVL